MECGMQPFPLDQEEREDRIECVRERVCVTRLTRGRVPCARHVSIARLRRVCVSNGGR